TLRVALIGSWLSSTLRTILPPWGTTQVLLEHDAPHLWPKIREILKHIDVYSATATAMDATLVKDSPDGAPRKSVGDALKDIGFNSFRNFVATDDQLAQEMLEELKLRGVNFARGDNHLVLLSEWDTFYARMLWFPYAAQLAQSQGLLNSQAEFIERYRNNEKSDPPNLHSFVYLRGLDGQTVGNNS